MVLDIIGYFVYCYFYKMINLYRMCVNIYVYIFKVYILFYRFVDRVFECIEEKIFVLCGEIVKEFIYYYVEVIF